jgi:hypothetical protein
MVSQKNEQGAVLYDVEGHQLGRVTDIRGQYVKVGSGAQPEYWVRGEALRPSASGRLVVVPGATRYPAPGES